MRIQQLTGETNMLGTTNTLVGYKLECLDGELGKVKEFYFDDEHWVLRYLVAETGSWLIGKQVLVSPHALRKVDTDTNTISVELTKKQIEDCPPLATHKPVSRQYEESYYGYYGWPVYWSGSNMWGMYPFPRYELTAEELGDSKREQRTWDPHLRSSYDVSGHVIEATDGEIGHLDDFIIDEESWAIRYLVIDTGTWLPGKKILISTRWISQVSWADAKISIGLTREAILKSPEYKDDSLLTREYETELHNHYDQRGYWVEAPVAKSPFSLK